MVVGLVGITVVFFGLVQIAQLGHNNVENLVDARAAAEKRASGLFGSSPAARYVSDWRDGVDRLRYTADDTQHPGFPYEVVYYKNELQEPVDLEEQMVDWGLEGYDWVTPMMQSNTTYAGNLRRSYATRAVPMENALQEFIFDGYQSMRLYDEVYMPLLEIEPGDP